MAIKYLDSKRIRGSSTALKTPTYTQLFENASDSSLTGNNARILGTNSFLASDKNCGDGYNHYTGGNQKTLY